MNEEREYQAGNLPLPTDEEYEQDARLEEFECKRGMDRVKVVFPMMTAKDFLNDTLPDNTIHAIGAELLESGLISTDQYFAYCESRKIKVF
jgi:hypothetical protein